MQRYIAKIIVLLQPLSSKIGPLLRMEITLPRIQFGCVSASALVLLASHPAAAQTMPGMAMPNMDHADHNAAAPPPKAVPAVPADPVPTTSPHPTDHGAMHDMKGMGGMEGMDMSADPSHTGHAMMHGALGPYSMARDASGTAWQPDSEPHQGIHGQLGGWKTMLHGYATAIYDDQGGRRGDSKTFVQSHVMVMAQHSVGEDTLTLHGAFSLDPLMGNAGYPLLLQTGETADGKTPLIDRQHPHNLFSELSATYSHLLGPDTTVFVYVGYPGEPALGPVTYLHRFAGMANPETPIDHHWLDSTHVTFGVVTGGIVKGPFKLEVSDFTGREPDQHRWGFNRPRFDSWSTRLTFNPAANWSMQISYGSLHSPEQLTPEVNQKRITASATYNRPLAHGNWETSVAWGQDRNQPGNKLNAYLAESALNIGANTVFGRAENADKDELFVSGSQQAGQIFNVSKFSLGYFRTLQTVPHLALDLGGLASKYALPATLNTSYGHHTTSFMLFARVRFN